MKVDWMKLDIDNNVFAWTLVEAMTAADIMKFGEFDSSDLDVVMTVNGIEVPILEVMENLQRQINEQKEVEQRMGYEQAVNDLHDKIDRLMFDEE